MYGSGLSSLVLALAAIPGLFGCGTPSAGSAASHLPRGLVHPTTPDRSGLERVELVGLPPGARTLAGRSFVVYSALGDSRDELEGPEWERGEPLARADARGDFLLAPSDAHADAAAEVSAYFHLHRYLDHYRSLGFAGLDAPLHVAVNYRPGGERDFLAGATDVRGGPGLVVGQWGDRNLAYDPDVLGHELFHVVHSRIAPGVPEVENRLDSLGFDTTPMAVAEAAADYFSCSLSGDPDVGEYTAEALELPYLSSLANDRRFPEGRTGQSHADGQALSGALWEVRGLVGAEALDRALYETLAALPALVHGDDGSGSTYGFPLVVEQVLAHLPGNLDPARRERAMRVFDRRGLTAPSRIVDLEPGRPRSLWLPGSSDTYGNVGSRSGGLPSPLQLRFAVPADAEAVSIAVRFEMDDESPRGAPGTIRVFGRVGEAVRWAGGDETATPTADGEWAVVRDTLDLEAEFVERLRGRDLFLSLAMASEEDADVEVVVRITGSG